MQPKGTVKLKKCFQLLFILSIFCGKMFFVFLTVRNSVLSGGWTGFVSLSPCQLVDERGPMNEEVTKL